MTTETQTGTIAGWPWGRVLLAVLMAANLIWSAWATREILALGKRQIVTVSLATLVGDFVKAEARNGGDPASTEARTRAYLAAIDKAVANLGRDGTVVLVSEATLGRSVPDRTAAVRADLARTLGGSDAR